MLPPARSATFLSLLCAACAAHAVDSIALELGHGDDDAERVGARLTWDWPVRWFDGGSWYLGGYWEVGASHFDARPGRTGVDSLIEVGGAAVFRFQRDSARNIGLRPYLELGIGAHYFSETALEDRDFDIHFTFAEHLGGGIRFGSREQWDLSYRFQHLSNGSIGDSNPGIDFHLVRLGYYFAP